jgi:23S rRNA pseudouridine1911/1915/1917 synthase
VHKPAGLPVHKTGKIFFNTLVNLVRESEKNSGLSPVFRLDTETSGIVAFRGANKQIHNTFPEPWIKLYLALVPKMKLGRKGQIAAPLGKREDSPIRCQMYPLETGKQCLTYFSVIANIKEQSLVAATPITGRTHQIRSHLASIGHPVIGDKIYSHQGQFYLKRLERELTPEDINTLESKYHKLHCYELISSRESRVTDDTGTKEFLGTEMFQALSDWKTGIDYGEYLSAVTDLMK